MWGVGTCIKVRPKCTVSVTNYSQCLVDNESNLQEPAQLHSFVSTAALQPLKTGEWVLRDFVNCRSRWHNERRVINIAAVLQAAIIMLGHVTARRALAPCVHAYINQNA